MASKTHLFVTQTTFRIGKKKKELTEAVPEVQSPLSVAFLAIMRVMREELSFRDSIAIVY